MKKSPIAKNLHEQIVEQYFTCNADEYATVEYILEAGATFVVKGRRVRIETLDERTRINTRLLGDVRGTGGLAEELDLAQIREITAGTDQHPRFVSEVRHLIRQTFARGTIRRGEKDLASAVIMSQEEGVDLWEAFGRLDSYLIAVGLVAAGRVGNAAAQARTMALLYFREAERWLVGVENGLFARFQVVGFDVLLYEIDHNDFLAHPMPENVPLVGGPA